MTSISIIIPTYNRYRLLKRTLDSLVLQNVSVPFNVIVADDGSTDDHGGTLDTGNYPFDLQVVHLAENAGRAAARNRALATADGDIIVFLDDDMLTTPLFLAAHLAMHRQAKNAVVLGNIQCDDSAGLSAFDRYWNRTGVHRLRSGDPIPFKYFATGNASVSRALLDKTGPFDEDFKAYGGEDVEMGYRLSRLNGSQFVYASEAVSYHLDLKPFGELLPRMHHYGQTSLFHIYRRHPDLARELKLDVIEKITDADSPADRRLKLLHRLLYHPPAAGLCRHIAVKLLPGRLRYPVYDYLISYHYLRGLRERLDSPVHSGA